MDELDKAIENLNTAKTQKNIAEYNQTYNELMELRDKLNQLFVEISKYRTITLEQQEKGFL